MRILTPVNAAKQILRHHKTRNPFEIAVEKNINIIFEPLGDIYGFYHTYKRSRDIHINSAISEPDQLYTCAHELGHCILHPKVNTPFLMKNTLFSVDRIEREANVFAVELLIPDEMIINGMSIYEAAKRCCVPMELAVLKKAPQRKL